MQNVATLAQDPSQNIIDEVEGAPPSDNSSSSHYDEFINNRSKEVAD